MSPSYSSFKSDLTLFNSEEYIKIICENESFTIFSNFLENYKDIEHEDFKKPIFSQTSKFKKKCSKIRLIEFSENYYYYRK